MPKLRQELRLRSKAGHATCEKFGKVPIPSRNRHGKIHHIQEKYEKMIIKKRNWMIHLIDSSGRDVLSNICIPHDQLSPGMTNVDWFIGCTQPGSPAAACDLSSKKLMNLTNKLNNHWESVGSNNMTSCGYNPFATTKRGMKLYENNCFMRTWWVKGWYCYATCIYTSNICMNVWMYECNVT